MTVRHGSPPRDRTSYRTGSGSDRQYPAFRSQRTTRREGPERVAPLDNLDKRPIVRTGVRVIHVVGSPEPVPTG